MDPIQIEYMNYRNLLKGNYLKGIHAFRNMLLNEDQAQAFAANKTAVGIVLDFNEDDQDQNSKELLRILCESDVLDTAILTRYGISSIQEVASDSDILDKICSVGGNAIAVFSSPQASQAMIQSDTAMDLVIQSDKAMMAIVNYGDLFSLFVETDKFHDALSTSSAAMNAIVGSEVAIKKALSSETFTGSIVSSEIAMKAITSSQISMREASKSALMLNKICKVDSARTAWMQSPYAHTYYDEIYDTLHNSDDSLFTKYETHYGTAYTSSGYDYGIYSNTTGSFSEMSVYGATYEGTVSNESIVLLDQGATTSNSYTGHYGSSQTKEVVHTISNSTLKYLKTVFVGGMSYYSNRYGNYGNYMKCTYMTYAAV